jgi:hypothetical protein
MDAVGADDEVVVLVGTVGEAHRRSSTVFQVGNRRAEPHRHLCSPLAKRLVQVRSMDCHAAADAVPDSVEVDVGERTAPVIEDTLATDRIGTGRHRSDAELVQCSNPVSG